MPRTVLYGHTTFHGSMRTAVRAANENPLAIGDRIEWVTRPKSRMSHPLDRISCPKIGMGGS